MKKRHDTNSPSDIRRLQRPFLATLGAMKFKKRAATVAMSPMLDFLSPKWSVEGIDLGASKKILKLAVKIWKNDCVEGRQFWREIT